MNRSTITLIAGAVALSILALTPATAGPRGNGPGGHSAATVGVHKGNARTPQGEIRRHRPDQMRDRWADRREDRFDRREDRRSRREAWRDRREDRFDRREDRRGRREAWRDRREDRFDRREDRRNHWHGRGVNPDAGADTAL